MVNLDELERLAKAATPGPWMAGRHDMKSIVEGYPAKYIYTHLQAVAIACGEDVAWPQVICNAEYIVAACNAVPELIAENRTLGLRVRELELREAEYIEEREALLCTKYALERQREWLAEQVVFFKHKDVGSKKDSSAWIKRAEEATKEME